MEQTSPVGARMKARRILGSRDGLFQRNGWWWIDYTDAEGKRHRKKAAPTYQAARMIYRDTVAKIARGEVLGVREEGIRLRDFVEQKYWPAVQPTLSFWEQRRARVILDTQILLRFGGTRLVGLRREEIERWQAERLATVSGSTVNKEVMRLKHLLNRAVAWGYLKDSPARAVKRLKEAPGRVRYLTPEEREKLLNGADSDMKAKDGRIWTIRHAPNPTLRLYVVAALQTGARRGELLGLRWRDVDLRARMLTFRTTKNGDARPVPMTDTLRDVFHALPRPLDPAAHVFPERDPKVLSRSFARLVERLKIKDLRFHDLRHDAASTLTMAGVPQRTIKRYLGLVGAIFRSDDYELFRARLEEFKRAQLPYDPDDPPILHREDIVQKRYPFHCLQGVEKRESWDTALLAVIEEARFLVVAVVIDKIEHGTKKYRRLAHPYHYSLQAMLERYCGWLSRVRARGDVMAESRGGTFDRALKDAYDRIYRLGGSYPSLLTKNMVQATLTSKHIKIKPKNMNVAGLQLADLLAHPLTRDVLFAYRREPDRGSPFAERVAHAIEPKYNHHLYSGRVNGYGRVILA